MKNLQNNLEKWGLSEKVVAQLNHLFLKYPEIEKVIIYGSRAMGTHRPGSDIDLTIFAPTLCLSDLLKIENEIDDLMLIHKIDLSLYHQLQASDILSHIERVGQVFYSSDTRD
jgi:predicted nucleotidyltransferase